MLWQASSLFLVLVAQAQSQFNFGGHYGNPGYSVLSRCPLAANPCRLRVEMRHSDGSILQSFHSQVCICNGGKSCSSDWSLTNRVIARNLHSATMNVTFDMLFCEDVSPRRVCSDGDIALEVSGSMLIPDQLEHYHCRCIDNRPLYLKERTTVNHRFHHKYVCRSHFQPCTTNSCMSTRSNSLTYNCECPSDKKCEYSILLSPRAQPEVYCTPR
ncbi:hypothetical protein PoB_001492800 [Plakobranchus ocellatus]|uniref:Uncharacterized protein n=1 Tax=Plakobranchus ocellatus TaxID=259542 RepID=A0AAV3Z1E2_9GAST|nr:hypothetical protein PoB_001492800 [Plakobranchus ocellatus]